ncbi:MAG: hypothetical protein WD042_06690 [Phycisphaeraceae bacterium]
MLTLFSIPKPFDGHIGLIQQNALASWVRLGPWCRVMLLGDDRGVAEAARQAGTQWLGDIERNNLGTPLLSDAFAKAARSADTDWLCYVNADIILTGRFGDAMRAVHDHKALLIAERRNVDLQTPIDFADPNWQDRLEELVRSQHAPVSPSAIDLFAFPRGSPLVELPGFAVGRPHWDNWFIAHARRCGYKVVDASGVFHLIHQNHSYAHVPQARDQRWAGPEGDANARLAGGRYMDLNDATHLLTKDKLVRVSLRRRVDRWLAHQAVYRPGLKRPIGWCRLLTRSRSRPSPGDLRSSALTALPR